MRVSIVYDDACPICRSMIRASRLRARSAALELIDARRDPVDAVQGLDLGGLDFDAGFAVVVDGELHFGAAGARMLSLLTESSGVAYGLFRWLTRSERSSRFWYPVMRACRGFLLRVLRIPRIDAPGDADAGSGR